MTVAHDAGPWADREVALVDLLDRLLAGGVVLTGDIVLSIADVDLVQISLRALIRSVSEEGGGTPWWTDPSRPGSTPSTRSTPTTTPSSAT